MDAEEQARLLHAFIGENKRRVHQVVSEYQSRGDPYCLVGLVEEGKVHDVQVWDRNTVIKNHEPRCSGLRWCVSQMDSITGEDLRHSVVVGLRFGASDILTFITKVK